MLEKLARLPEARVAEMLGTLASAREVIFTIISGGGNGSIRDATPAGLDKFLEENMCILRARMVAAAIGNKPNADKFARLSRAALPGYEVVDQAAKRIDSDLTRYDDVELDLPSTFSRLATFLSRAGEGELAAQVAGIAAQLGIEVTDSSQYRKHAAALRSGRAKPQR